MLSFLLSFFPSMILFPSFLLFFLHNYLSSFFLSFLLPYFFPYLFIFLHSFFSSFFLSTFLLSTFYPSFPHLVHSLLPTFFTSLSPFFLAALSTSCVIEFSKLNERPLFKAINGHSTAPKSPVIWSSGYFGHPYSMNLYHTACRLHTSPFKHIDSYTHLT